MRAAILTVLLLAGCATTADVNYMAQLDAYRQTVAANQTVAIAQARADEARWTAIADIASRGDIVARQTAIIALAMGGKGGGTDSRPQGVVLPTIPESQEDKALRWAGIFAGPVVGIVSAYYGYRVAVNGQNQTANTTIASYNSLGLTAAAGYAANSNIAGAGFQTVSNVVGQFPTTVPSVTNYNLNGTGVIGSGSYVGPNSGAFSGNLGRLLSPDLITRNCTGGNAATGPTGPVGC